MAKAVICTVRSRRTAQAAICEPLTCEALIAAFFSIIIEITFASFFGAIFVVLLVTSTPKGNWIYFGIGWANALSHHQVLVTFTLEAHLQFG
jgi:hypothetical protein